MLNAQLPTILQSIYKCMDIKGEKFAYALLKNKNKIEAKMKAINEKYKAPKEHEDFENERQELAEKFSKKDEKGEPIIIGEKYDIEDQKGFDKAMEKLKDKYDVTITEIEFLNERYKKEMDEECDIEFHKVETLPENISARELEAVSSFMFTRKDE